MVQHSHRALKLALVLGGTLLVGLAPATANAGAPHAGMAFSFGPMLPHDGFPIICLTDYQVRQRLMSLGYSHIYLNAPIGHRIQARATKGRWVYLIEMNRCTGRIIARTTLRPS